ncbi:hypothetical protein WR25_15606 isoform B [Diploscapter pachys]|uniref:SAM domain-containing protein n=1 Tax=Diploscapter pachys TaxID=2018661 RepID=A0A2A2M043_9BILA|nr:hypothetical protein WR25_15606 isoform B [Diploscapter pachys]
MKLEMLTIRRFSTSSLKILLISLLFLNGCLAKEKPKRSVIVTPDEEKVRDAEGYKAISEIHREMDDDHSGSIDRKETTGFMMEDMQMRQSDRARKEQAFHGNDDAITIDDLWEAWFESKERAWSVEEIAEWLLNVVNLPMYVDKFKELKIDGAYLPRLAMQNQTFMVNKLDIRSSVHRQKLRLNALDVVLFGHRDHSNRIKDIALALSLVLLSAFILLYIRLQKKSSQEKQELSSRLMQLKSMEDEFQHAQKNWNEERSKRSNSEETGISQIEVENLKIQLEEAERRHVLNHSFFINTVLEQHGVGGGTPLALQPLLRKTCENELVFLEKQRQDCVNEMKDAIEMVDRLQKKQSSVLSSIRLATGQQSSSDQVDSKIFALKSRMEKIHSLTKETQERWMQIESLCGFPLLYLNDIYVFESLILEGPNEKIGKIPNGASSVASSASHQNGNSAVPLSSIAAVTQAKIIAPKMSTVSNSTASMSKPSTAALPSNGNSGGSLNQFAQQQPGQLTDSDTGTSIGYRP